MAINSTGSLGNRTKMDNRATMDTAWRLYDTEVKRIVGKTFRNKKTDLFEIEGIYVSNIDVSLAKTAAKIISNAPPRLFSAKDAVKGYWTALFEQSVVDNLNRNSTYLKLDAASKWSLSDIVDTFQDEVMACLGTPFRVLNTRAWSSNFEADQFGPYDWHTDGMPNEIFKIMVYLTPIDASTGGLELDKNGDIVSLPESEPGTWVLFRNSSVRHRGIPGQKNVRLVCELTLCRATRMDSRLRTPGENSQWPTFPWVDYCEGSEPGDVTPDIPQWNGRPQNKQPANQRRTRRFVRYGLIRLIQISLIVSMPLFMFLSFSLKSYFPTLARKFNTLLEYCRSGRSGMLAEMLLIRVLVKLRLIA